MLTFLNRVISFCFYGIFLVVPLTFAPDTSELFEFNKMWLTFGLTIIIAVAWLSKMMVERQAKIQRTPLDIPLGLFLLSQIISTIFSLDSHVSFWGYYSRFNGGLLSTLTYIFLYYAFVSNVELKQVIRYVFTSIISGVLVSLWGLPSHFGYDPTCLVFRGTFDVSCWTDAFQPKVRIFSTMGQPDWLAAYLVLLTPISFALGLYFAKKKKQLLSILLFAATFLFYLDNLYTRARSGFVGMIITMVLLLGWYLWTERKVLHKFNLVSFVKERALASITVVIILVTTFFTGTGIAQIDNFTYSGLMQKLTKPVATTTPKPTPKPATTPVVPTEFGGTDSGKIRLYVWQGALKIFMDHPIFGTGVETFAFAYYKYRPAAHNLTSEWDYLYNKAHNEYLNYLATTGIFGLGTYLAFLFLFLFIALKKLWHTYHHSSEDIEDALLPAFVASLVSIMITNFFGFSVVTLNTYLFLLPAFFFFSSRLLPNQKMIYIPGNVSKTPQTSGFAWFGMTIVSLVGLYFIIVLIQYRSADVAYALGQNLDNAGQYQQAFQPLHDAVQERADEPVFQSELSLNDAVLATAFVQQKDTADAQKLMQEALTISNAVVTQHPNNVVFWKTRVRVLYMISQLNQAYMAQAQDAIEKAQQLAPTDAKIAYNVGLVYGQTNQLDKAIAALKHTIQLKVDYRDAYYALAIYEHQKALGKDGKTIVDSALQTEAVGIMHFILAHFDPHDQQVLTSLSSWGEK